MRKDLIKQQVDRLCGGAFLVTDIKNIRYLSNFTGSSGMLLFTESRDFFITDFRYEEQSKIEVKGFDIIIEKTDKIKAIGRIVLDLKIRTLGFEARAVTYDFYKSLSKEVRLKPFKDLVERLRVIKDKEEVSSLRQAVSRAEAAFKKTFHHIRVGRKERDIAVRLEGYLRDAGCVSLPFDIIVASGPRSAMPHASSSERALKKGDIVVMDWGGEANGYFSDMTRTFFLKGRDLGKKIHIYETVLDAQRNAIKAIREGRSTKDIDAAARTTIKRAGYGEFFGHSTGHGIGLSVHESPNVTWGKGEPVKRSMVFTVEPGIYIPGLGGVRIEDMIVAKGSGAEVLTHLPRELQII